MPEELDVVFEAAIQKALNFLSERGFNRELRQEQKSSVKQLFTGGDLLALLRTGFGKSLIFQLLALVNDDHLSIEKYCKQSNQGGLFDGDFGWLVV